MDPEPTPAAPKETQAPTHPLNSVLAITRTIEVVSNVFLVGIVVLYAYNHFKTFWPWYCYKFDKYCKKATRLFHRTLDILLDDEDYPEPDQMEPALDAEEDLSDEQDYAEPVDKIPAEWELVREKLNDSEATDSEYDTSSEDRVSLSSNDEFDFSTPAGQPPRRVKSINPILAKIRANSKKCCCDCHDSASAQKERERYFIPQSVIRKMVGRSIFPPPKK